MKVHQITKQTLSGLESELHIKKTQGRPKVIEQLAKARECGDLSENADYDAAKKTQGELEGRIKEIEAILDNYEIINIDAPSSDKVVRVGSKVTIKEMDTGEEFEYEVLGTLDNDPIRGKISNESPLALSILGYSVGDVVKVKNILKSYDVKILKVN